ncbi:MAG: 4-(cytidine 5'-diphospho)-2-C-methyl-D-erythritol kinase [Lachnospiraceae bacterium]|nr:4-(cytidine 5'-diphospho)-2-C-methyl-D-erythritol kinase [Lachnospiraceae bacterium]
MNEITLYAMAKINLGLDVLRRREDGYHDVKMIMQNVNLYDTLTLQKTEDPGITITIEGADLSDGEDNLIRRAAKLMREEYGISRGVGIRLTKRIPIAAGMAGGSVDAAATLKGMNHLFDLGASREKLEALGLRLGADVPFCISGGTVLAEGIGERLTLLPPPPDCYLVIAKPGIGVSSKYVYENLHADTLEYHPDIDGMADAIRGQDLKGIIERMGNVLERVTQTRYPVIVQLKHLLMENGAANALMSGSGPTVFGIFTEAETAASALSAIRNSGLTETAVRTEFAHAAVLTEEELQSKRESI